VTPGDASAARSGETDATDSRDSVIPVADIESCTTDSLDDLAAFVMHRNAERGATDAERLEIFAAVEGYQECDDPSVIEPALRAIAARYADHPDYRTEWRPSSTEHAAD
jgi:hypothetical protein